MVGCSSHYITYIDEISLYASAPPEPLPVDHEYSWCKLCAAGVRRVGYGLEVGRSVRTAGGAGHIGSPRAQLVIIIIIYYARLTKLQTQTSIYLFALCRYRVQTAVVIIPRRGGH